MEQSQIVNGRTANSIVFGRSDGSKLGTYRQVDLKTWEEVNSSNVVSFRFQETHRDEWSVYLHDASRKISLQLDLHRKMIVYTDSTPRSFDLYSILSSSAKVNGWVANQISFSTFDGKPLGNYKQTGEKTWIGFNKVGQTGLIFEETHRDDWSVYLHNASRKVFLQLDLHRKKIVHRDATLNWADLYDITDATTIQEKADLVPPISGNTVNKVDFSSLDGKALGQYRQTGDFTWVGTDIDNVVKFYFVETKRHKGTVYLYDPSRYVTLEIHINTNKIIYSDAAANRSELYSISKAYTKINGWVANRVGFRTFEGIPLGEYRQTGENTWVELNHLRKLSFRLKETHRDDWSVYLHDASRAVSIQLDLHTQKVVYSHASTSSNRHVIEYASSDPKNIGVVSALPVKGRNVHTVAFGGLNGQPLGYYRQTGESTWVEVGNNHQVNFTFEETKRDHDVVYLYDATRKVSLQINLNTQRITYTDSSKTFDQYTILHTSAALNGWLVSEITFGSLTGTELGKYRQTGDTAWAEFDKNGNVSFHFKEIRREDWSIFLHDATRNVSMELDLLNKNIIYGDSNNSDIKLYKILSESVESGLWLHSETITSRSSLTEDFQIHPTTSKLIPNPVYRTSVSFTTITSYVDIWASEEVTVEIEGQSYTIDPVKSAQVKPSALSKVSISIPATDVHCPKLILRTNLMMPDQKHYIFPDVEAHKKIVSLKEGELFEHKERLGIGNQYTKEDVDHFQKALQNVAKTVQHTYNKTPHGVHHDRAVLPTNMQHPHFKLDLSGGNARYQPLHPSEVPTHIAGARLIQGEAAQSFFGEIGHFFEKAASIVVHTVENVAHDIVQTVENVGHDIVNTVETVGEDIIHGDISHIGQDLLKGGESIGGDLIKGAGNVGGDLVKGAGQLVVITLKAADEAIQFVLTHTGVVGKVLSELFQKIGATALKVVDWLLDKIGWSDILHTHDVLFDLFNRKLDEAQTYPEMLKKEADNFFTHLTDLIRDDIDKAINQFDVLKIGNQPSPVQSHSGAVEKIEWFLGKFMNNSASATALSFAGFPTGQDSPLGALINLVEQELGKDGDKILVPLQNALGDIAGIFSNPDHAPEYLLGAVLEIVKAVATLALDSIKLIFDMLMDLIEAIIKGFKDMMNAPWHIPFLSDLYKAITEGREMRFLSFTCLLISIPTTIIYKAEFKTPPFQSQQVGTDLTDSQNKNELTGLTTISGDLRAYSIVYSTCHIILAPIAVIADVRSGINAFKAKQRRVANANAAAGAGAGDIETQFNNTSIPVNNYVEGNKFLSEGSGLLLNALDLGIGFIAQTMGCPIAANEPYALPDPSTKFEVLEAPNYWSHVIWVYQWFGWGFNVVFSIPNASNTLTASNPTITALEGYTEYVSTIFNFAYGITHMALMGVLDVADRDKNKALRLQTSRSPEEDNYLAWVDQGGIPRKGYGNVMDAFPEIGQFAAFPYFVELSGGYSLIATGFFDVFGHLGEGITVAVRTSRDGLL